MVFKALLSAGTFRRFEEGHTTPEKQDRPEPTTRVLMAPANSVLKPCLQDRAGTYNIVVAVIRTAIAEITQLIVPSERVTLGFHDPNSRYFGLKLVPIL